MDGDGTNQSTFANLGSTNSAIGLAVDSEDNIYASSSSQNKIVKIIPDGTMTDFATVISPTWVSIGKDGYLYASSGDRSIQKFDLSGTKIAVYQTGSLILGEHGFLQVVISILRNVTQKLLRLLVWRDYKQKPNKYYLKQYFD
jgi:sugar lactone lactonase YvrE